MQFRIDGRMEGFHDEPTPSAIHDMYMAYGCRITGVQQLYDLELHDLYVANGLYPVLIGGGPADARRFYDRHPGLQKWRHYVGPLIVGGMVSMREIMMWASIDTHLRPSEVVHQENVLSLHRPERVNRVE